MLKKENLGKTLAVRWLKFKHCKEYVVYKLQIPLQSVRRGVLQTDAKGMLS